MPTRKIADASDKKICFSRDHSPPSHQVFSPGTYEHECSACGHKTIFTVKGIYFDGLGPGSDGDTRGRREW